MSKPVLSLRNVSKIYHLGETVVHALKKVSIDILPGDFVAVVGPSGSGKSTLLHMMGCLDRPTNGKVLLDGHDVTKLSDEELAKIRGKMIGFVFQFFQLVPSLKSWENVALPRWFQGVGYDESRERAQQLLNDVGLTNRMNHLPSQLSGGQQQRVAIARALANDPKLILADEPTGNLDSHSGKEIIKLLEGLHETGKTIVIVTHDPHIAGIPEKTISIYDGQCSKGMCLV